MKHISLALFALTSFISLGISSNSSFDVAKKVNSYKKISEAENGTVEITSDKLEVGSPIETATTIDGELEYVWYVDDAETNVTTSYYTPSARDYESWIQVVVYKNGEEVGTDMVYFSTLPVAYINTVSGEDITTRDYYVDAAMKIQGNYEYDAQYDGKIEIKGRGTASWHYDKKPYKIKLDKKTNLFGFGKNKHFVLLANFLDPSQMRNMVGYQMGNAFGLTSTDSEWINVIVNEKIVGVYQITEHVRVGKQLVDIFDYEDFASEMADALEEAYPDTIKAKNIEDTLTENLSWVTSKKFTYEDVEYDLTDLVEWPDTTNGYLLEIGDNMDEEVSYFKTNHGIKIAASKPEYLKTNDTMFNYVKELCNDFDDAIRDPNGYDSKGRHYSEIANVDSMVSYWLINEIMGNEDASSRSRFCYIGDDGKITFGPVWDFDISSNSKRSWTRWCTWAVTGTITGDSNGQDFYREFIDDPYFQMKAREKYWYMRDYLQSFIDEDGYIDTYKEELYESSSINDMLWTDEDGFMFRSFTSYDEEINDVKLFKEYLRKRLSWLDEKFDTKETTIESLYMSKSTNAYSEMDSDYRFSINNAVKDTKEHGTDYVLDSFDDVSITLSIYSLCSNIYVNGKLYKYIDRLEYIGNNFVIPSSYLNDDGSTNVIMQENNGKKYFLTLRKNVDISNYSDPAENNICNDGEHEIEHIASKTITYNHYGINECYYCNKCHHYFADEEGKQILSKEDVIITPYSVNKYKGANTNESYILPVGIACTCVGAGLVTGIVVSRSIRKKKEK